jgi:oligoribonuclease (3'-5' exoribonuclease)
MNKPFYVVIDLEMTGMDPDIHEIIDVCMIVLNRELDEVSRYKTKVTAHYPAQIQEDTQKIIGYDETIWKNDHAMSKAAFESDIIGYFKELNIAEHGLIPIGHGVSNDLSFLLSYDIHILMHSFINCIIPIDLMMVEMLCEMKCDEVCSNPASLQDLCNMYGVTLNRLDGIHTATGDAEASLEVFRRQMGILCTT